MGWSGCGPSVEERAAERAVESCIAALEPVAEDRRPAAAVLESALADAEEAARGDDRWEALAGALRRAAATAGTPAGDAAVARLVDECRRARELVRRGGRESAHPGPTPVGHPQGASGWRPVSPPIPDRAGAPR
ncbi:MAG: hypothetical protein ACLGIO_08375 [Acidimicrobiia bacterium]